MSETIYPEMRRKDRQLSAGEAWAVIQNGQCGVLSTVGEDGLPYGVPLSYVARDGKIYFHCALEGRKLRNLAAQNRVCFTVVEEHRPVFQGGHFSATYKSAVAQGKATPLTDPDERRAAFMALIEGLTPEHLARAAAYIDKLDAVTAAVVIVPEQITGKARPDQF